MHRRINRPSQSSAISSTKSDVSNLDSIDASVMLRGTLFVVALLIAQPGFSLTLKQAEEIAQKADPLISSYQAEARSLKEESVAKSTLPDPKFRLGLFNVPVDSLSLTENATTQLRVGIQQHFPRGDILDLQQEHSAKLSDSSNHKAEDARRMLLRDVRTAYFDLYYEDQAHHIIEDTSALFEKLVDITQAQYAAGRGNQQDVIRAELELSRLKDRMTKIMSNEDQSRAQLSYWIGDAAKTDLTEKMPSLPEVTIPEDINQLLINHPAVLVETAKVEASKVKSDIAKQDYMPDINAFFEYRIRDGVNPDLSQREDMLAAMVVMDIPFFTGDRQDKSVAANEEKKLAATLKRDDKLRMLKRMLEKNHAAYDRLTEREKLYKEELLSSAKNNSAASLQAYQSGITEFTTLMRAQITELDVRLADLRIRIDREKTKAKLLYITGEKS